MPFYMKRPIVIDAIQYTGENAEEISVWSNRAVNGGLAHKAYLIVDTKEGTMRCPIGGYVICGVAGEFYPCDEDIFAITYKRV